MSELIHGDCLDVIKTIPSASVDAIVTDPPYLYLKHKLDRPFDEDRLFAEFKRVIKPGGFIVMFGRGIAFYRWNLKLSELGFQFKEEIVWNKRFASSPMLPISRKHELISILSNGNNSIKSVKIPYAESKQYDVSIIQSDIAKIRSAINNKKLEDVLNAIDGRLVGTMAPVTKHGISGKKTRLRTASSLEAIKYVVNGTRETSIIELSAEHYSQLHPTQKPVALMKRLINLVSDRGDNILDPFAGSGSTGLACIELDRKYIMIEIDEQYFNIAKERIKSSNRNLTLSFKEASNGK